MQFNDVTVVIPTYNGARYIADAIHSAQHGVLIPREIIIVDDHSTDNTCDVVNALAPRSSVPLHLIRSPTNSGGPAKPINTGIASAMGNYIVVLDQDDMLEATALRELRRVLEDPTLICAMALCGNYETRLPIDGQAKKLSRLLSEAKSGSGHAKLAGKAVLRELVTRGNLFIGWPACMFRRLSWHAKGGADEKLRIASDHEFASWLASHGDFGVIPQIGYWRRHHDTNLTKDKFQVELEVYQIQRKFARSIRNDDQYTFIRSHLNREAFSVAHNLRERGRYWDSFLYLWDSIQIYPLRMDSFLAILKLLPHYLFSRRRDMMANLQMSNGDCKKK